MLGNLKLAAALAVCMCASVALADNDHGYVFSPSAKALAVGTAATAGLVAHLAEARQPSFTLYGFVEVAGEREHVALATCDDVDTDEFLPEGIAVPFVCDDRRFVAELGDGRVDFLQDGREKPVATIDLAGVDWVNGLPVGTAGSMEPQDDTGSLGGALRGLRPQ